MKHDNGLEELSIRLNGFVEVPRKAADGHAGGLQLNMSSEGLVNCDCECDSVGEGTQLELADLLALHGNDAPVSSHVIGNLIKAAETLRSRSHRNNVETLGLAVNVS